MSDALKDFKAQSKLEKGFHKVAVQDAWKTVMGDGIMSYTTKMTYRGTTLFIDLSSSVLREELSYGRSKIIENLNEHLGEQLVEKLVLR